MEQLDFFLFLAHYLAAQIFVHVPSEAGTLVWMLVSLAGVIVFSGIWIASRMTRMPRKRQRRELFARPANRRESRTVEGVASVPGQPVSFVHSGPRGV